MIYWKYIGALLRTYMANLPFVVQPRRQPIIELIGSEDSGKIEIKRLGYLTSGEKSFVQQVQQYDGGTSEIVTLSRRVARQCGTSMDKSYNLILAIISGNSGDEEDSEIIDRIEVEFAEELTGIVRGLSTTQLREDLVMAACLIKYRIDPDFEIADIAGIHPDLISDLAMLYRDEERRSIEAFIKAGGEEVIKQQSAEETEKKPNSNTKSRSKAITTD